MLKTTVTTYRNYINGGWVESASGETFDSINPADHADVVGRFQLSAAADVTQAIEAAEAAFPGWAALPVSKRAEYLNKAAEWLEERVEQIAEELTREEGKIIASSRMEVKRAAATLRYYAVEGQSFCGETFPSDDPASLVFTLREPLGVVAVITPWNFPISIPARKIAPALITGNTVVFKPASDTPLIGLRLVEALVESGIPAGVVNFITGSASRVGGTLVTHPAIRAVTFTGSTQAGETIHRSVPLTTRTQMELGGKNPLIVLADADLDKAVELAVKGGFELTGQACTGTSRVIVQSTVYHAFLDKLVAAASRMKIGNGLHEGIEVGPLANASQLETVLAYVKLGVEEGATLLCGGERLTEGDYGRGYYVRPAVFADVKPEMRIAQEEIFGPVLAVISVKSLEEALQVANQVEYGLSAAIATRDIAAAQKFIREIQSGTVKVNRTTTGNVMNAPFGGIKKSSTSTFRESGRVGLEFYTQLKTVYFGF